MACPRNNSSQIWARITKFTANMSLGIHPDGIENTGHWLWPPMSFWQFWLRILGNLAYPRDNSSQFWARITKFAPNTHLGMLLNGIENDCQWRWHSMSFLPFWLRILGNLACPRNNSSQIWARITKFAPNVPLGILWAGIENSHWPWPSRSIWPFFKKRHSTLLLYLRSSPTKESDTSQTCSCSYNHDRDHGRILVSATWLRHDIDLSNVGIMSPR